MSGNSHQFQTCSNCGGAIELASDGRSLQCPYCGRHETKTLDPTLLANALQSEFKTLEQFFEHLAGRLSQSFPQHTKVETSGGFFSARHVESFEVTLEPHVYRMRREGGQVRPERVRIVRGVALKTEHLPVDQWLQGLCESLANAATASATAHEAVTRMFRPG